MALRDISYVIHIASTPDRVWQALTGDEALRQNWGLIHSKWTPGARVEEVSDSGKLLWQGEVLEVEPGRHLSFTFDVVGSGEIVGRERGLPVREPGQRMELRQVVEPDHPTHGGGEAAPVPGRRS